MADTRESLKFGNIRESSNITDNVSQHFGPNPFISMIFRLQRTYQRPDSFSRAYGDHRLLEAESGTDQRSFCCGRAGWNESAIVSLTPWNHKDGSSLHGNESHESKARYRWTVLHQ